MDEFVGRYVAIDALTAEALERNLDSVMDDDAHRYSRAAQRVLASLPDADVIIRGWHERTCDRCGKKFLTQFNTLCCDCEEDVIMQVLIEKGRVAKRKRGKWMLNEDGSGTCSECGFVQKNCWDLDNWDNFCHHCGCDMRPYETTRSESGGPRDRLS